MGAKEDHENLFGIATRAFGDAADQVEEFVKSGMESLGYKPRIEWDDPEPDPTSTPPPRRGPSFGDRPPPPADGNGGTRQRQVGRPPRGGEYGG